MAGNVTYFTNNENTLTHFRWNEWLNIMAERAIEVTRSSTNIRRQGLISYKGETNIKVSLYTQFMISDRELFDFKLIVFYLRLYKCKTN
jgi:hypothetical protein